MSNQVEMLRSAMGGGVGHRTWVATTAKFLHAWQAGWQATATRIKPGGRANSMVQRRTLPGANQSPVILHGRLADHLEHTTVGLGWNPRAGDGVPRSREEPNERRISVGVALELTGNGEKAP